MRAAEVILTDEQRATLRGWLGAAKTERRMAFRAEVILAIAEGLSNKAVAERVGARPAMVSKWRGRFAQAGSGAARLAAIPAGASPANTRSPVHVVVISSGSEGDQTAGSLEVKALWGRGDLVRSVKGGRATWQAVA